MFCRFFAAPRTVIYLAVAAGLFQPGRAAETVVLEVQAGRHERQGTPVFFQLPTTLQSWESFRLTDAASNQPLPVQLEPGPKPRLAWIISQRLPAGQARRYRLAPQAAGPGPAPPVSVGRDDRCVRIEVDGKPVLNYNHALVPSDEPKEPYYGRSGFIHPLFDPSGQVLTDAMPPDHMHQHGIMFAWVDTVFEGRTVDFWNSKKQQGEIRHVDLAETQSGPVFGSFTARLDHLDLTAPGGPKVALHETWIVRVYRAGDGFLFDLHSTQTCAGSSPLAINKFDYGGLAVRGAREWFGPGKCEFLTSEGKTLADGNHTRARWCEISGRCGDHQSGITVFCHPDNFCFPQPLRLHPSKPYFCWAPMVLGPFAIEPGKPYVSAYRYYVHQGKLDAALAGRLWNDFVDPPQVRIAPDLR
jgi:hypothetical protein